MDLPAHRVAVTAASDRMQLRGHEDVNSSPLISHSITTSTPQSISAPAATTTFALHNQDLIDVMAELERYQVDHRAAFAFELAQGGRVHPLNEDEMKHFRKDKDGVFGPSSWDTPTLSRELPFAFTSLPSPASVENAIKNDIGGENHFRFAPSRGSPDDDAAAIMHLLDNIQTPGYSEPGAVVHMQSPTFNRARRWIPGWEGDGMLANLDLLRKAYGEMHAANTSHVALDILAGMQHGIFIIQKPGQSLLFPPFWSHMTFNTATSVSSGFFIATAAQYMYRIKNMDLWLTLNLFWDAAEEQQKHLENYAAEIASHFYTIMAGNLKRFKAANVQNAICSEWVKAAQKKDPGFENMKDKISGLLELIKDEEERQKISDLFRVVWIEFIRLKRKKRPECRLCHVRIEHMPAGETPDNRLARHVTDVHCNF